MHKFSDLPYAYGALEPYIDATTMEIHHTKHHKAYFDKFMAAIKGTKHENKSLEDIFDDIKNVSPAIRNNAGGFFNHNYLWDHMSPDSDAHRRPQNNLSLAINDEFGTYDKLMEQMTQAGIDRFGSGFVWLVVNGSGRLQVGSTPNQDNPLMPDAPIKGELLMAIDVWEHAYYLKYQNKRPDYLDAFWKVVDWRKSEISFVTW